MKSQRPSAPQTSPVSWLRQALAGKRFYYALALVTLLAFAVRLLVCLQLGDSPSVHSPAVVTDMATYRRLALEIRLGGWPAFFDYQPFYYAVFLPLLWLFSPSGSMIPVFLAQSLLGAAAVALTGLACAQLAGRKAGFLAAMLLCLSKFHVFYTPYLLLEVLQSFWMVLLVYLGQLAWRRRRLWQWGLLGLVAGASTLTRGNILLFMPGIVLLALIANRSNLRQTLSAVAVCLALFYAIQLPFSLRNYQAKGRWTGPSVAGNKVLVLGNSPEAPDGGLEYPRIYSYWEKLDEMESPKRVSSMKNIFTWAFREPLVFCELNFRKALLFWNHVEIPNNVSIEHEKRFSPLLRTPFLASFGLISTLAVAGCLLMIRRCHAMELWILHDIVIFCLATALFYILARFRIAGLPLLAIAGGYALGCMLSAWEHRDNRRRLQLCLLAIMTGFLVAVPAYSLYMHYVHPAFMALARPNGLMLDYPDRTVCHDHGPLNFGGSSVIGIGVGQQRTIFKRFAVPEKYQGHRAKVLLRVTPGTFQKAVLTLKSGKEIAAAYVQDRMASWLVFDIGDLDVREAYDGVAISLAAGNVPMGIVCDQQRDYGRSALMNEAGETIALDAEWTAELEIY